MEKVDAHSMSTKDTFTSDLKGTQTPVKSILARLSLVVRGEQLEMMMKLFLPTEKTKVLDVGFANDSNINLVDTNFFEKKYLFPASVTAASVEDCDNIRAKYAPVKIVKIEQDKGLPFKDREFEVVTSWATLEHVGGYAQQRLFLDELFRVGKSVFLTVPYRGCIYEPHSGFFFLHWLPLKWFRALCRLTGREAWASESILNPLYVSDLKKMLPSSAKIKVYKMFGFLPSHLIVFLKDSQT